MTDRDPVKYLIIGNSAGGIGAAEAIREVDKVGAVTIVSDEPYPAYSRPLISEYLAENRPLSRMLFRPPDFYEKNNIQVILGQKVTRLDTDNHTIKLDNGQIIVWEKLLLATGSSPIMPKIDGSGLRGIFTFTTLDDAKAIDQFLLQYRRKIRAVVIGGGLIGVSVTEALVKRGVEVTIVEMKERILSTILDQEASAIEETALKEAGVEIITGHTVDRVSSYSPGEATGVTLDDSRPIPVDMIVIAVGVQPRLKLVDNTGIRTNRGIVVDTHMATSSDDVYACGDVAESWDLIHGENRLTPVWPNAYSEGRIAGANMTGVITGYRGGTTLNSMKYFGVAIVSAGMVTPIDDSYETISRKNNGSYRKLVLKDGLIAGIVFSGNVEKSGIVYNLMKDRVNVNDFKQELVADDLSLISLPESIWRPLLAIPPSIPASRLIPIEQSDEMLAGD